MNDIENAFRADTLDAVMYSVRKWLPDDYVEANPETAAADAREIALKAIEKQEARAEAAEADVEYLQERIRALLAERQKWLEDKPSVPMAMLIKCRDIWPPDGVSRKE